MKGKVGTIIVILFTLILAGAAIFTAIRLYQLRNQSVAPNVPESKPKADELTCGGIAGAPCPTGKVCIYSDGTTRAPFADASGTCQTDTRTSKDLSCVLSFTLGATASPTPTPTPTPTPVPQCNASCTSDSGCPSTLKCNIATGATTGSCRAPLCLSESDCICGTSTPTPTATPTPTPTTPGSTPNACNGTCGSNLNCQSNFVCYQGFCRNPSCTGSTTCGCGTSTSTPIPGGSGSTSAPSLPDSGTTWPTWIGVGIGIFVILGSLILAI